MYSGFLYISCGCDGFLFFCNALVQSIPGAVAEVRGNDGKSPLEAADFILHILKVGEKAGVPQHCICSVKRSCIFLIIEH